MATMLNESGAELDLSVGSGALAFNSANDLSTSAIWAKTCAALKAELGDNTFESWIAHATLRSGRGDRLVVVTPTGLARDWIRRNAWRRIAELWAQADPEQRTPDLKSKVEFEYEYGQVASPARVADVRPAPVATPATAFAPALAAVAARATAEPVRSADAQRATGLQERYTFDTFVAGPTNEFALSVARRVANWSDGCFNPVLFHGPYGFGKTHLLNAIAWEAQRVRPEAKIVYLTAERFLSTFVKALMERTGASFKDELRTADLLLIDDVHFIGGKKSSQEELFHTLTALMGEGRRVVFSADRPPSAIAEIDGRLRSHLGAGLICGIEAADRNLRLGVVQRKLPQLAASLGVDGRARPDVLQFLADRFPDSIRELEGGLNTLVARAGERLGNLSLEEAANFLRPHLKPGGERRVTVDDIQRAVAEHYGLKKEDLLSERRTRSVARPRQTAMYLAKQLTTRSYPDIGRRFGGRDHTTVLHAVRRIEELKGADAGIAQDIEILTRKLRDG
jgi:chromosomal replication initiator protein